MSIGPWVESGRKMKSRAGWPGSSSLFSLNLTGPKFKVRNQVVLQLLKTRLKSHRFSKLNYMTNARFSSSC
jgi:hypothetical protein